MHAGTTPAQKLVLDLIRHGEPEGGVMYRGSKDDPLSATGWKQMRSSLQSAMELGYQWDKVIASPLQRCRAFAESVAEQLDLEVSIIEDLKELNFGDLEGMRPKDAWQKYPELLTDMWHNPEKHTAPNGESFPDFVARVKAALDNIIQEHQDGRLLLVVHGGVVRASLYNLIHVAAASTFKFDIPYASLTRFKVYPNADGSYETALSFVNGIPAP